MNADILILLLILTNCLLGVLVGMSIAHHKKKDK